MDYDWRKGMYIRVELPDGTITQMEATEIIPKGAKLLSWPERKINETFISS